MAEEEISTIRANIEEPEEAPVIKKRIFVVDSKEKTLDEAIKALRKGDFNVVGVEGAAEFFHVTSMDIHREESDKKFVTPDEYWQIQWEKVPDLIITDTDLRDHYGWEFIFDLKFDPRYYEYKEVPVIVRSDEAIGVETVKRLQAESIHDYIPKTVKGDELLKKVESYFETLQKLEEAKKEIKKFLGHRVGEEYKRLNLAIRINLKYLAALKKIIEESKKEEGYSGDLKEAEEVYYLRNRELIRYERRKREIKKLLKVKKDERADSNGDGTAKDKAD